MPILSKLIVKYSNINALSGLDLGICLHITKETSVLILGLKDAGASISLCSANPLSTKTEIRDFLKDAGICIFANKTYRLSSFYSNMDRVLDTKPQIITDDGGELHKKAIGRKDSIQGGTEETTSGINRLRAMRVIPYPIIAVNHSPTKYLFDNTFGTGQSIIEALIQTTSILIASKRIVVCGYGWVGKGVSRFARGLGAKVSVTEVNPLRAMEAYLDGFEVARLDKLLSQNDIFITCTGQINVIGRQHFGYLKDGAILCNAGHFDVEIDVKALESLDRDSYEPIHGVTCYKIGDGPRRKKILLLARGRVVNLVNSEGNSPQVMDLSFANQFLSIIYLFKFMDKLPHKVLLPPNKIHNQIARHALISLGLGIDNLTVDQKEYFKR